MHDRNFMRYTPIDMCHRLKTRLKHTCANVDRPIRSCDMDVEHEIGEIDEIMDSIEEIQEDLCEMYSPKVGLRDDLNSLMDHILKHLDEAHYMLMDRATIGGGHHNEKMKVMRQMVREAYHNHLMSHPDVYTKEYDLKLN